MSAVCGALGGMAKPLSPGPRPVCPECGETNRVHHIELQGTVLNPGPEKRLRCEACGYTEQRS